MAMPLGFAARAARPRHGPRRGVSLLPPATLPVLLALVAALCFWAGADALARHFRGDVRPHRAASGVLLILSAVLQARIALVVWRRREKAAPLGLNPRSPFWRRMLIGPVVCYLVVVALGPDPYLRYLFRAAMAWWYTATLAIQVTPAPVLNGRLLWRGSRAALVAGRLAFLCAALLLGAESSLRLYSTIANDPLPVTCLVREQTLTPGSNFQGRAVNHLGYWDDEFTLAPAPGVFRVAVLGDEIALSGAAQTNFLERIERANPAVEICNFGLRQAGPREYAAQLGNQVLPYQPHLVLTIISVGDDITHRLPLPDLFNWRGLHLVQFGVRSFDPRSLYPRGPVAAFSGLPSREAYLRDAGYRLRVCQCPMDGPTRRRWDEALGFLDHIVNLCRAADVPLALIVAPAEYQLDEHLQRTLCRRQGYKADQFDDSLPQRRLAVFASQREAPLLDLLPHFRIAGEQVHVRNDHRWNDRGNQLAADVIGDWLQHSYAEKLMDAPRVSAR